MVIENRKRICVDNGDVSESDTRNIASIELSIYITNQKTNLMKNKVKLKEKLLGTFIEMLDEIISV